MTLRTVATCSVDGVELGEWLVRGGRALDWPKYSRGKYDGAQREAEPEEVHTQGGEYGRVATLWYRACIKLGGKP